MDLKYTKINGGTIRKPQPCPELLVGALQRPPAELVTPCDLPPASDDRQCQCLEALAALPPSIEGSGGDAAAYRAAQECKRFGLDRNQALHLMLDGWNELFCEPPWQNLWTGVRFNSRG